MAITDIPEDNADLQYIIYTPSLSHLGGRAVPALLNKTAGLFNVALLAHLPKAKTLRLKFYISKSVAWSAILPAHHNDTFSVIIIPNKYWPVGV